MNVVFFDLQKETILISPLNVGFSNEKMAIRQNDLDINKLCTLWVTCAWHYREQLIAYFAELLFLFLFVAIIYSFISPSYMVA